MGLSSALAAQAAGQQQAPPHQQQQAPPHHHHQQQQQQQQGWLAAPPAYAAPHQPHQPSQQPNAGMASVVAAKLHKIVQARQLQAFYSPERLNAVVARVTSTVDFHALAARWRMPVELAVDLSSLALYDCVIYADDSGSMESEGGERVEDLKLIVSKVAEVATLFDDDGIEVRFINSNVQGNHIKTAHDASRLVAGLEYRWDTKIGTQLEAKVLAPLVYNRRLAKPLLVVTVTDGEPSDKPADKLISVIQTCVARTTQMGLGPHAVAFQFAQVGKDREAQEFLSRLDRHPQVGGMIDCTSYFELEQSEYAAKGIHLSVEAWLVKLLVGAIDPEYDEQDEGGAPPPQQPPQYAPQQPPPQAYGYAPQPAGGYGAPPPHGMYNAQHPPGAYPPPQRQHAAPMMPPGYPQYQQQQQGYQQQQPPKKPGFLGKLFGI